MAARFFLYRRNGMYYFRWTIPRKLRERMVPGSPAEVRLSLRTADYNTARQSAARHWLAALDARTLLVVTNSPIDYNNLLSAIQGRVLMAKQGEVTAEVAGKPVTLAELLLTADVPRLQDAIALLQAAGAEFFVDIPRTGVSISESSYDADGELVPEVVAVLDDFADAQARVTRNGLTDALSAHRNVFQLREVHSDQPGMWRGPSARREYHDLALVPPVACNLSSLKVASKWAGLLNSAPVATPAATATATTAATADCEPILLSKARDSWLRSNSRRHGGNWTTSTEANNGAAVSQFIDIVGDKLTTKLTAEDFSEYERVMRTLPTNWAAVRRKTGHDFAQIALEGGDKAKVSPKTLKDKGGSLGGFFGYLAGQGYWHGRYGKSLFTTVRQKSSAPVRYSFSDGELQEIFSGRGIAAFEKAKFPLYAWGSILLLYTGARPGEVSQLKRQDVQQDPDGTWFLQFREEQDDDGTNGPAQALKTEASFRAVPLHPAVLELGFLRFIERFKGGDWLFPETFRHDQRTSREIGDWANQKLLVAAGLKAPGVVLYSLRHTIINRFKYDATLAYLACAYTGHSTAQDQPMTNREFVQTYGKRFSPTELSRKLHPLLSYDIDWAHIKTVLKSKGWN